MTAGSVPAAVRVDVFETSDAAGDAVAARLAALIRSRPEAVIGVATGASVEPVYRKFVALAHRERLELGGVRWFALDEYVGLPSDHPQSYRAVLLRQLLGPLGVDPAALSLPDARPGVEYAEYDELIQAAGGIDRQLLGIGRNGHLAFNEPGTPLNAATHRVTLTAQTRSANAPYFASAEAVPTDAVTQGLGTIARARELELVAFGPHKARVVRDALLGPVDVACPASLLQRHHAVRISLDSAAAELVPALRPAAAAPA